VHDNTSEEHPMTRHVVEMIYNQDIGPFRLQTGYIKGDKKKPTQLWVWDYGVLCSAEHPDAIKWIRDRFVTDILNTHRYIVWA
jgi:hypothetical protein